jgi:FkbM family methyltransferase
MTGDKTLDYGFYAPPPFIAALIAAAQRCPRNRFGRLLALSLRKLALLLRKQPVDTTVGDVRLRCHLHDNVSERKFLFLPWLYDPEERDLITRELPKDGVFVDIGANVGIYTLWAARSLSRQGRIIAFEPQPRAQARLLFNVQANRELHQDWPDIRVLPIAVSDREGEIDLHVDRTNLGGGSLVGHADVGGKIRVQCRPLLPVLAECGVAKIDILKIDIEGAEDIALAPFLHDANARLLPRYMIIENSERLWRADLASILERRGYRIEFRTRMNTVYRYRGTGDGGNASPSGEE